MDRLLSRLFRARKDGSQLPPNGINAFVKANTIRQVLELAIASAKDLTASGTELTYTPTIFSLENYDRFGVEARIVRTADGLISKPVY